MRGDDRVDDEKWEIVHTTSGMTNAYIIMGRLKTEGIPTRLKYDVAGTIYAVTIDGLGEVEILVPAACLEKAREVLSQSYEDENMGWKTTVIP